MYNNKKNMRMTIAVWIVILVCGLLTMAAVNANAADPNFDGKIVKFKYQAVVILWYTDDGKPHGIFIEDAAHISTIAHNNVVIDRKPEGHGVDQVIIGGLIDMRYFSYKTVFKHAGDNRWEPKEKFQNFASKFKVKASGHLSFGKDDITQ